MRLLQFVLRKLLDQLNYVFGIPRVLIHHIFQKMFFFNCFLKVDADWVWSSQKVESLHFVLGWWNFRYQLIEGELKWWLGDDSERRFLSLITVVWLIDLGWVHRFFKRSHWECLRPSLHLSHHSAMVSTWRLALGKFVSRHFGILRSSWGTLGPTLVLFH